MNFFYHPSPPPTTIESGHSEFMKLSYSDRIDRCVPYISEHLDAWRDVADRPRPKRRLAPEGAGALRGAWRRRRGGPGDREHLPRGGELRRKDRTYRRGREFIVLRVRTRAENGPNNSYPDVESLVGSGDEAPKADNLVVRESPIYDQGEFAGVTAEGRPSKIVEVIIRPGKSETHRELGFAIVGGHDQGVRMWALNASVNAGSQQWKNDIQNYRGF